MMQNKFLFGITGPTGAGKTTVSDIFRENGIYVCDCDDIAHKIMEKGSPCLNETGEKFPGVILSNGSLDRKKLGDIVFSDKNKLALLNSITHKYILDEVISQAANAEGNLVGVDGAVIIGSGIDDKLECIVSVIADESIRLERIMKRDGISEENAKKRMASQKINEFYIANSDYIIYNNNTNIKEDTRKIIAELWKMAEGSML